MNAVRCFGSMLSLAMANRNELEEGNLPVEGIFHGFDLLRGEPLNAADYDNTVSAVL